MDVFISWSGERSKYVAESLSVWLKRVIQVVRPWMSSEDILAGARWNPEIAKRLEQSAFGIVCVTPENLTAPWLTFESGALAKTIDQKTRVCPYLIDMNEIGPQHPLSQFQCKRAVEDETYDIVRSIHATLVATDASIDLTESQVKEQFEQWWPKLSERLAALPPRPSSKKG